MMRSIFILSLICLFSAAPAALADQTVNAPCIVPRPVKFVAQGGAFALTAQTPIEADSAAQPVARQLAAYLAPAIGYDLKIVAPAKSPQSILISIDGSIKDLGKEGYRLRVSGSGVSISAPTDAGAFYAVQTLRQLLPPAIFQTSKADGVAWTIPCVEIEDQPRFSWRGMMVDSARHFFTKDEILKFLDEMAIHKLNTFHWHLVDDQGWRIEIKKYPNLAEKSAWRESVGFGFPADVTKCYDSAGRYGGFYTQDQIREVVAYAAERHITIVPEIEMPGHAIAALVAYPDHSCTGGPFTAPCKGGVFNDVDCAGNEVTFEFLQNVLAEVVELFPGSFVHVGGDECPKTRWAKCPKCQQRIKDEHLKNEHELQSYFIRRIEKFLNSKGKRLIGWDEILEGGLAPNATVMSWHGLKGGAAAAAAGHDAVMTPTSHCYLDYYQAKKNEPKAIGGFLPLEKVYSLDPMPAGLTAEQAAHILGVQGNLWTEFIPHARQLEYMAWPRGCALAEIGWSPKDGRDFADFHQRLGTHLLRLKACGANFRPLDSAAGVK